MLIEYDIYRHGDFCDCHDAYPWFYFQIGLLNIQRLEMGCNVCKKKERLAGDQIPISFRYELEPKESRLASPIIRRPGQTSIRQRHRFLHEVDILLSARLCPCDQTYLRLETYADESERFRIYVNCSACGASTNRSYNNADDAAAISCSLYWADGTEPPEDGGPSPPAEVGPRSGKPIPLFPKRK